jgi:predicted nuclease of predicted toxin-antitoxin system
VKFVDVNLSPEWAQLLTEQGHVDVHWRDVGVIDALDDDILVWAAEDDRIVFTADLDFGVAVATRGLKAPSVVQLRLDNTDPLVVGKSVLQFIAAAGESLVGGAILTIEPDQARLRPGLGTIAIDG